MQLNVTFFFLPRNREEGESYLEQGKDAKGESYLLLRAVEDRHSNGAPGDIAQRPGDVNARWGARLTELTPAWRMKCVRPHSPAYLPLPR